jgi:hypothetical protein
MTRNYLLLSCTLLMLSLATLGMGSNKAASAPLSLEGLHLFCGLPLACDSPVAWEGKTVSVWGHLDPRNTFDKRNYPQLPYEKFRLTDDQGRSVEIWALARDNRPIFEKLAQVPGDEIVVQGRLAAIKMPVSGNCKTGVKMEIDDARQITFKTK